MTTNATVKIELTHPDAKVPEYAKKGDAGADVRVVPNPRVTESYINDEYEYLDEKNQSKRYEPGDWLILAGQTKMLDLGLKIQLLPGWEMQVRSRSGLAKRGLVVANQPGTIDSGYRGPCMVLLRNNTRDTRIIKPDTRVAQFVLKRAPQAVYLPVESLEGSDRGEGGFGSTGTK